MTAFLVFIGAWASGYLIIATHSWMQNPVGHEILANGKFVLKNFSDLFSNPWLLPSFFHNQMASLVTTSFVIGGTGAFYLLVKKHHQYGMLFLKTAIITGAISTLSVAFPTGDLLAQQVAKKQPVTLSAMEGLFNTEEGAPIVLIGQPNMKEQRLDNKIEVPNLLSFLTYQRWNAEIKGLNDFPEEEWPINIPGLYYSYHIMVGLGTVFIGIMLLGLFYLWRKKLALQRWYLYVLLFAIPFPYIANTAGWYTSELGRQPYLVYGLFKTADGVSENVSAGNSLFTLLGFVGLYLVLGFIMLILVGKIVHKGPETTLKNT
jgi:cytochrome d ubiquinol oxidase subunit I